MKYVDTTALPFLIFTIVLFCHFVFKFYLNSKFYVAQVQKRLTYALPSVQCHIVTGHGYKEKSTSHNSLLNKMVNLSHNYKAMGKMQACGVQVRTGKMQGTTSSLPT